MCPLGVGHSPKAARAWCPAAQRGPGAAPGLACGGHAVALSPGPHGAAHHPRSPSAQPPRGVPCSGQKQSCGCPWDPLPPQTGPAPSPQPPTHLEVALAVHGEGEAPAPEARHRMGQAGVEPGARASRGRAIQAEGGVQLTPCTPQCQACRQVGSPMGV